MKIITTLLGMLFISLVVYGAHVFFVSPVNAHDKVITLTGFVFGGCLTLGVVCLFLCLFIFRRKRTGFILNIGNKNSNVDIEIEEYRGRSVRCQICHLKSFSLLGTLQVFYYDINNNKQLGTFIVCKKAKCINYAVNYPNMCVITKDEYVGSKLEPKNARY